MIMRFKLSFLVWGALIASLANPVPVQASQSDVQTGLQPFQISNGAKGEELYVPRDIRKTYENGTRSRDGKPGPKYWQNHASHTMRITLNPPSKRVEGEQEIIYTNNSPEPLTVLAFRLYMNAHQPEALRDKNYGTQFLNDGITVEEFSIDGKPLAWNAPDDPFPLLNQRGSTVHVVALQNPLPPKGNVRVKMRWRYDLVRDLGWKEGALDETSFFLAYFFPRVTNYSDYAGWDTLPFTLGREFNNDFADFDVEVNLPRDYVVWATGELQNTSEVLQPNIQTKLKASETSDTVATIAEVADVRSGKVTARDERLTWKWKASNVPDFAIAVSDHYRWEASSVVADTATGRRAGVQAAYPDSATDFRPMVEFGRAAIAFGSTQYPGVPYPYPKTTIVLGSADEEYPMMVNDSSNVGSADAAKLPENAFTGFVATHEILHTWFPFYMGINEKRYAFMDEGWTTAFEYLRNREVLGVEAADSLFKDMRVVRVGWSLETSGGDLPVVTPHDSLFGQVAVSSFNPYGKAATGFLALKDLMGDDAFRTALHEFMARWHGKRPLPWDMFNTFNNAGVGDYTWFFNNWFFGYNYMDLGLGDVVTNDGAHRVSVHNVGGMAMPFDLVLTYDDGSTERVHRTPAVWKDTPRLTQVELSSTKPLRKVVLDTGIFMDFQPGDNTWQAAP